MTSPTSGNSDNFSKANETDLVLPLAAVISLAITSYVVVVLVGIALQKWLVRICCSSGDPTTSCYCNVCPLCFSIGSGNACCSDSGNNCCSSTSDGMNCCIAGGERSCRLPRIPCTFFYCCQETSQPIDCQSCDCCCFEVAFHLKGRKPPGSGVVS